MTTFNQLHTVLEAAVNAILPCGQIDLVMDQHYTLAAGIGGPHYRVECAKPLAPRLEDFHGCFSPSYTREDGTALTLGEVAYYEIKALKVRVCLKGGVCSVWSAPAGPLDEDHPCG
jgi:hypothetical protein